MSGLGERAREYRAAVEAEMRAVVGEGRDDLSHWMRYHLGWEDREGGPSGTSAGKMMRPSALLLATEICGGRREQAVPAAAAVEILHRFSLLHDDIEDRSDLRNGRPALWTFTGDAHAINTGDGLFALARLAMHRLRDRGVEERRVLAAMHELDRASLRLVRGQHLDLAFEQRSEVSAGEYVEMARGKTAAMFAAPLAIGAILAGAPESTVDGFRRFGEHIGLAFQAVDDVLGIWGDPALTGKPAGDDLRARKRTLPVVAVLQSRTAASATLQAFYETPPGSDDEAAIDRIASLVEEAGGRRMADEMAREQEQAALDALRSAGVSENGVALCTEFARAMVGRMA